MNINKDNNSIIDFWILFLLEFDEFSRKQGSPPPSKENLNLRSRDLEANILYLSYEDHQNPYVKIDLVVFI